MGVLRRGESLAPPAGGVGAALVFAGLLATTGFDLSAAENALALMLAIFVLNGANFVIQALVPMSRAEMARRPWVEQAARAYVLAGFQATVVCLTLLWAFLLQL